MISKPTIENPFLQLTTRGLIGASLLILVGLSLASGQVLATTNLSVQEPIVTPALYILFFGLLSGWELRQLRRSKVKLNDLIGPPLRGWRWSVTIGLVIVTFLFSLGAFTLSFYLLSYAAPDFVRQLLLDLETELAPETTFPGLYRLLMLIAAVVVAPIAEEFIFRGILLHRWAAKWGIQSALILSSLIFGILHANVLGLSMFGLVMGLLYIRSRSLLVPIACHALNNALAFGLAFLPSDSMIDRSNALEQFRSTWWLGLLLLMLSAPWLIRFIRRNWPQPTTPTPYAANSRSAIAAATGSGTEPL